MAMKNKKNYLFIIALVFLFFLGFFYRIKGLSSNYSFWTDEGHVAIFSRAILERGKPVLANGYSTGFFQIFQYWSGAISAKIFGLNEFALRLPSVIFGVLSIWASYLLGSKIFNKKVGLLTAFFVSFLRIEILWSRQARPYQAIQFFFLLGAYFIFRLLQEKEFKFKYLLGVIICGVLATFFHGLGGVFFLVFFLNLIIFRPAWLHLKWIVLGGLLFTPLIFITFPLYLSNIFNSLGKINNLYFYRVFLWFNYSLFVFLGLLGILYLIFQRKKEWFLPASFLVVQFFIASFLLNQPFTRYFYIVFPFLILLASFGLWSIFDSLKTNSSYIKDLACILLALFIVGMGWKFALSPKSYYPLNEDMQEIPEVDWDKVYGLVKIKINENPGTVMAANWTDSSIWYLGEGGLNFLVRNQKEEDTLTKSKLVRTLQDFRNLITTQPKGIFVVDSWDNFVPEGIREYCKKNLKKELEVDRLYPIQPRYWPVEVYSWGI